VSTRPLPLLDEAVLHVAERLRLAELAPAARAGSGGERRARGRGQAGEFEDYRPYAPGDDLRLIDWNAYRRLDELVVTTTYALRSEVLSLLLDCSASMVAEDAASLERAASLCAGLAAVALLHGDRVRLWRLRDGEAVQGDAYWGSATLPALAGELLAADAGGSTALAQSVRAFRRSPFGREPAIVLSDLAVDDGQQDVLDGLSGPAGGALIAVLAPDPAPRPEPFELQDAETGERLELDLTAAALRDRRRRVEQRLGGWRAAAGARSVLYAEVPAGLSTDSALAGPLVDAGILEG
jgi:uncharacterized protein (DUF58 family)